MEINIERFSVHMWRYRDGEEKERGIDRYRRLEREMDRK